MQPVKKEAEKPVTKNQPANNNKPVVAPGPKSSTISLLLPFGLDHLTPGSWYTSVSLREADIALDYYRGFKLALDSLTANGYNYKLLVFDTRDEKEQSKSLATKPAIRASDLIVGPVFPESVKAFTSSYSNGRQPIVSPLSPASPSGFKSPQLVTAIPPLEYHAWASAKYIYDKTRPTKIFILRSGFSDENEYIIPFKKAIDSLSKRRTKFVELTVIHGQLNAITQQLSATDKNVFVMPSKDQHFLTVTLRSLDSLSHDYPITLIGHPNWANFAFLKADLLQRLDTHITSSDQIDYKSFSTVAFMRQYREAYHAEATAFSIKGFDEGLFFGRLVATGDLKNMTTTDFNGLHNDFQFQKKAGVGWVNTHVNVYKYVNFELKKEE